MNQRHETILECIERLAREKGSSSYFVSQVKEVFLSKGIQLGMQVAPYYDDLLAAFEQELRIRILTLARELDVEPIPKITEAFQDTDDFEIPLVPGPDDVQ